MVVEEGQADPARARRDIEQTRQDRNPPLVARLLVSGSLTARPSALPPREMHGDDGPCEGEGGDDPAGYEKRLQAECSDVGYEGYIRVRLPGIAGGSLG